jgi:thiosulfate reductase cytochrome b subunit
MQPLAARGFSDGETEVVSEHFERIKQIDPARYKDRQPPPLTSPATYTMPFSMKKYNALQRAAYFSVPVAGLLSVATGWAIHKPMQLHWLAALFGGYNAARVWHFWLMWVYILFIVPHVILVCADGWDTFRSMIVGWSTRVARSEVVADEQ